MLLPLQVKGAVFSQQGALQQIEAMCRIHRPEQKPLVGVIAGSFGHLSYC